MTRAPAGSMAIACALWAGCATEPAASPTHPVDPVVVETPSGASIRLPIPATAEHEVDGARELFRAQDGAVWSVQTLEPGTEPHAPLDQIAIALCRRVELGEVEGELTHRTCQFAGQSAQCIEGWQTGRDGDRIVRRGAILEAGTDVVWVSLSVRSSAGSIDALAESLATETSVRGGT